MNKPSIITGTVPIPNKDFAFLDFMDIHDGHGNMLIKYLKGGDFQLLTQIAHKTVGYGQKTVEISLTNLAKLTGLSKDAIKLSANRLVSSGLVTRTTDEEVAVWELHLENAPQAIKFYQSKKGRSKK